MISMWARIENNVIVELTEIDPEGRFHPDLIWITCSPDVHVGWVFDGSALHKPEELRPAVPKSCTPAQGLVALFALKSITEDNVLAAIGQIPDPVQQYTARIGYQRATTWERGSQTMLAMAQLLQLSETDLDELFSYAVNVQV